MGGKSISDVVQDTLLSRRSFLKLLALGLAGAGLARRAAAAEEGSLLQALIEQNQRRELDLG